MNTRVTEAILGHGHYWYTLRQNKESHGNESLRTEAQVRVRVVRRRHSPVLSLSARRRKSKGSSVGNKPGVGFREEGEA